MFLMNVGGLFTIAPGRSYVRYLQQLFQYPPVNRL